MITMLDVYGEFSHRLSRYGQVIMAGGAVRDHLMGVEAMHDGPKPKDYDIFLLDPNGTNPDLPELIKDALSDLTTVSLMEGHTYEPYLVQTVFWKGSDVQVMLSPYATMTELIDSFDWNVSLFGYDGLKWDIREDTANIRKGGTLWLQKVTFPLATLRRGFRFSERFGMTLQQEDIEQLCAAILESKKVVPV